MDKSFSKLELENIKKMENPYIRATKIAQRFFLDKKDLAGKCYLDHLYRVSDNFENSSDRAVALLHDLLEDTDFTAEDLFSLNFSRQEIETLLLLTKNTNEDYADYINRIATSNNDLAKKIKIVDILDNMNLIRIDKKVRRKDTERVFNQYINSYVELIKSLYKTSY